MGEGEHPAQRLSALSLESGEVQWTYGGYQNGYPIPNPTLIGDGRIFLTGGYRVGSAVTREPTRSPARMLSTLPGI